MSSFKPVPDVHIVGTWERGQLERGVGDITITQHDDPQRQKRELITFPIIFLPEAPKLSRGHPTT